MTKRSYGNSLRFYSVKAEGISMQIMCEMKEATGTPFVEQHEHLRRGDWIGVVGFPGRTQPKSRDSGELNKAFMSFILISLPSSPRVAQHAPYANLFD